MAPGVVTDSGRLNALSISLTKLRNCIAFDTFRYQAWDTSDYRELKVTALFWLGAKIYRVIK